MTVAPGAERGGDVGAALVGVHGAGPLDHHLQRVADVRGQPGPARPASAALGHPDGGGPHAVERLPELQGRLGPALGDGLHDRPHLRQHRLDVGATARQRGPQPGSRQLRTPQVDAGHHGWRLVTASIVPEELKSIIRPVQCLDHTAFTVSMSERITRTTRPASRWSIRYGSRTSRSNTSTAALKPIARFLPGTATIEHRGRTSGKPYKTIVTTFRKGNVLAITLGHGKTDWVKNVLAAGQADLHFARRDVHIINPRILPPGSDGDGLPGLVRLQLRRMAVWSAISPDSRRRLGPWGFECALRA